MTWVKSDFPADERRWSLTSIPRRSKPLFRGIRIVERGVVFITSAREVENMAARNADRLSLGRTMVNASVGGRIGRVTK